MFSFLLMTVGGLSIAAVSMTPGGTNHMHSPSSWQSNFHSFLLSLMGDTSTLELYEHSETRTLDSGMQGFVEQVSETPTHLPEKVPVTGCHPAQLSCPHPWNGTSV